MSEEQIEITVNGFKEKVPSEASIAFLIEHLEEGDKHLVVEHNGRCVFPESWSRTTVRPGDILEFVHPHFGG